LREAHAEYGGFVDGVGVELDAFKPHPRRMKR
jgi:hypothetical protein